MQTKKNSKNQIAVYLSKFHEDNRGVATLFSLIVATIIMGFCLSLLMVTYTLFAQTNRQISEQQCKMMAQSFAEQLKNELQDPNSSLVQYMQAAIESGKWKSVTERGEGDSVDYTKLYIKGSPENTDYIMEVSFTYISNVGGDTGSEENSSELPAGSFIKNCTVNAVVTCKRANASERNKLMYTVEKEYDVSFRLSIGE